MREHPSDVLSAYIDGVLSQEDAAAVAAHLAECEQCHDIVTDLAKVRTLLRSAPAPVPHPAMLPRVLSRLGARTARRHGVLGWRLAVIGAAAAAALALQWPLLPAPRADAESWVAFFQRHAEMSLTHPMTDVTLTSYLTSSLRYELPDASGGVR
jgi:anti-sigma factor RsiW